MKSYFPKVLYNYDKCYCNSNQIYQKYHCS